MHRTFWTTEDLRGVGWSRRMIADAVAGGRLIRIRPGHFCTRDADSDVVRAVRVGGVATGITGARALGLWVPPDDRLWVALPLGASRLRDPDDAGAAFRPRPDVQLCWSERVLRGVDGDRVAPVPLLLEHVLRTMPALLALTVVDSALHERRVRPAELSALQSVLPAHLADLVGRADGTAESGLETIVREILRGAGLRVEAQVRIDGVGRVDLLVEGRLIVELDGRAHHGDFERDRRRDAAAALRRYRTLRFSWRQVMEDPDAIVAAVGAMLAA